MSSESSFSSISCIGLAEPLAFKWSVSFPFQARYCAYMTGPCKCSYGREIGKKQIIRRRMVIRTTQQKKNVVFSSFTFSFQLLEQSLEAAAGAQQLEPAIGFQLLDSSYWIQLLEPSSKTRATRHSRLHPLQQNGNLRRHIAILL